MFEKLKKLLSKTNEKYVSTEVGIKTLKVKNNIKSIDPQIYGHSIRNIHIKHMLMHETEVIEYGPREGTHDKIRYVCIGGHPTPEKSTWNIEEVTCKNCLREIKTILHKKDYRGKRKAIYYGQLHDEVTDEISLYFDVKDLDQWGLSTFCTECYCREGGSLCVALDGCIYKQLITKMQNGMHDCPRCGGEKEWFKTIQIPTNPADMMFNPASINFITLWKCKVCKGIW
jgi:hypothetical protein